MIIQDKQLNLYIHYINKMISLFFASDNLTHASYVAYYMLTLLNLPSKYPLVHFVTDTCKGDSTEVSERYEREMHLNLQ